MSQENVEIVRAQIDALNRRDLEGWLEAFDSDVEFKMPPNWPDHQGGRGRDAALASMRMALDVAGDVHVEAREITELDDDRLLVGTQITAQGAGSGIPIRFDRYDLITMRGGKVSRAEIFLDREEALEAARQSQK